ncbi:hypothetical protein QBC37DRAFT_446080, partial [Rhypophila decipiens]
MPAQNKKTISGRGLLSNSLRSLGLYSQARPRTRSHAKSNFLGQLTSEILLLILRDSGLDSEDVKNVRLVCRQFSYGLTTQLLFHTAHLSRFRCDLDSFLGIASQPRLACEVRVLVWHEVFQTGQGRYENLSDEEIPLAKEIENTLERIDWLGGESLDNPANQEPERLNKERKRIDQIKNLLRQGVWAMTKLHTLVSKPMHPTRRLTLPGDEINYPLTAQSLALSHSSRAASEQSFWELDSIAKVPSFGLDGDNFHLGKCLRQASILTSLSLCFENGSTYGYQALLREGLKYEATRSGRLIQTPTRKTLPESHKCRLLHEECAEKKKVLSSCSVNMLNYLLEDPQHKWEGLRELRLTHCDFQMRTLKLHLVECDITVRDILTIAKQDLEVTDTLDLREFKILQSTAGDKGVVRFCPEISNPTRAERAGLAEAAVQPYWVDEDRLLSLVNASFRSRMGKSREAERTSQRSRLCTEPQEAKDTEFINLLSSLGGLDRHFARQLYTVGRGVTACTHHAIFDSDSEHCHSYAIADACTNGVLAEELYGKDELAALEREMGRGDHAVRIDPRGHHYHSSTLFSPQEHNDSRYLEIRDQKEADDDGGDEDNVIEWFDYSRRPDLDDDEDDDKDDGFWWVAACDSMGVFYLWKEVEYRREQTTREQNIREHRELQAAIEAQWKPEEGDMDAQEQEIGRRRFIMTTFKNRRWNTRTRLYRTECWKFVRRHPNTDKDDEIAYGREPLEHWADWGRDANDEATPTPYGLTLWFLLNVHTLLDGPNEQTEPGSRVCSDEEIKAHGGERFAAYGDGKRPLVEPPHQIPKGWRHGICCEQFIP